MKQLLIRGLALSLGLLATAARAEEARVPITIAVSRPAGQDPAAQTAPVTAPAVTAPAVTLGRPVVIASTPSNVQPVSFRGVADPDRPVVRGAAADLIAQPLPAGPGYTLPPSQNWRRAEDAPPARVAHTEGDGSGLPMPTVIGVAPPVHSTVIPGPGTGTVLPGPGSPTAVVPESAGGPSSLFATNPDCGCTGGAPAANCQPGCGCGPVIDCPAGCGCGKRFVGGRCGDSCRGGPCGGGTCGTCAGSPGCSLWGQYVTPLFANLGDGAPANAPWLVIDAEYLLWWMKGDATPPLVVAIPPNRVPDGTLNGIGTRIGGQPLGDTPQSGGRLSATYWFSDEHLWGIGASAFFLGLGEDRFGAAGGASANPTIGRLFFATDLGGAPAFELVSGLGLLSGNVEVVRRSSLWGYDVNLQRNLCNNCYHYMNFLVGFREVGLDESLRISENLVQATSVSPRPGVVFPAGTGFSVTDKFSTSNRFYGGQVGLQGQFYYGDFFLGYSTKVAIGTTTQIVTIDGSTSVTTPTGTTTAPGGLLAQNGTNIGRTTHQKFGVIPEVGMTLGYNITDWWSLTAGYNFLYWNSVVRPGEQVNLNVNRTTLPFSGVARTGPAQPAPLFHTNDFYAHGITLGMQFRF